MSFLSKQLGVLFISAFTALSAHAIDGNTQIPTQTGYKAISDIQVGDLVLSKNEVSNQVEYQAVSHLYNKQYEETVYLTVIDDVGNVQTLKTNKSHPFFVQSNNITPATEGYIYQGNIGNANWTDASFLKVSDKLLSENGTWQTVHSIQINQDPIMAYDLTVNNSHTFFVKADDGKYGVWVHNNTNNNKVPTGWISRDVWNSLTPALQKKFDAAMKKGIVAPTGQQGVIVLSKTEPLAKQGYTHKLKILGQGGDLRIYGKQQPNGHIIYDRIEGH